MAVSNLHERICGDEDEEWSEFDIDVSPVCDGANELMLEMVVIESNSALVDDGLSLTYALTATPLCNEEAPEDESEDDRRERLEGIADCIDASVRGSKRTPSDFSPPWTVRTASALLSQSGRHRSKSAPSRFILTKCRWDNLLRARPPRGWRSRQGDFEKFVTEVAMPGHSTCVEEWERGPSWGQIKMCVE